MTNLVKLTDGRRVAAGVVVVSWALFSSVALAQAPTPAEPPKTWTGTAGVGVSIASGNSDTMNYNLAFDVTRTPKARNVNDLKHKSSGSDLLFYDSKDLVTHAVCVGMTGSGKTGLCLALIEDAAIDGVPALIIDPKGDLSNLLLTFPNLSLDSRAGSSS